MDKNRKLYQKAMEAYNDAKLDKASKYVQLSLDENPKDPAALNLKGLLMYLRGELDGAQQIWKLNFKINNDGVSKKYLENIEEDRKLFRVYIEALSHSRSHDYIKAIELLEHAKQSDFNMINVNNLLAECYFKQGQYILADNALREVLKVDSKNIEARELLKDINSLGSKQGNTNRGIIKGVVLTLIIMVLLSSVVNRFTTQEYIADSNKGENSVADDVDITNTPEDEEAQNDEHIPEEENSDEDIEIEDDEINKEAIEDVFDIQELSIAMQMKNFEAIKEIIHNTDREILNNEEREYYDTALYVMSSEGTEYFYNKGQKALREKEYTLASEMFKTSYEYAGEHYLKEHALYLTGFAYEGNNDADNAIMYYDILNNNYQDSAYREETLYRLANIYREIDLEQAKVYAMQIQKEYPYSQYNNSIIRDIITE